MRGIILSVHLLLISNLNRFLRVSDEVNSRRPKSRHLVALMENLAWYGRKFEDIRRRLEVCTASSRALK